MTIQCMKHKTIAVLPAYNAKATFKAVVDSFPNGVFAAIILSDDGSKDGTYEAAKKDKRLVVIKTPRNLGYGGNLKFCLSHALEMGADVIVEIHPDGEYQTDGILPAIAKVNNGAHLVLGNRFLGSNNGMYAWKNWGTRVLSAIDRVVLHTTVGDLHQGFRVYTKTLLEMVPYKSYSNNYLFSFEIIVDAFRNRLSVGEVPVSTSYTGNKRGALPKAAILYATQTFFVLSKKTRKDFKGDEKSVDCPICHESITTYSLYHIDKTHSVYQCYACGCAFTTPPDSNLSKQYQDRYYNLGAISIFKQWVYGVFQRRRIAWLTQYIKRGSTIVDVGAGNGTFGTSLEGKYNTISLEAPFAKVENTRVLKTDMLNYTVKKPIDAVIFWESLEHMDNPEKNIQHASSWLKNGGFLFVEYPRFDSWESKVFGKYWYHLDIPRHRTHYSSKALRQLFEDQGYIVLEDRSVWAMEYAVVGCAASMLGWSPDKVSKNLQNPLFIGVIVITLVIACPIEIVLAILGQSPIGLIVAKKNT